MVTVKNAIQRNGEEKSFVSLELTGDIELVQSQNTGRFYATARRCFISSTFDLETAKQFIGKQLPGRIVRVQSDPYEYEIPETGEVETFSHTYAYQPEARAMEETINKKVIEENLFEEQEMEPLEV